MGRTFKKQVAGTTSETIEASCAGCQFFVKASAAEEQDMLNRLGKSFDGTCHRAPPDPSGHFAPVPATEWCGSFEGV